MTPLEDDLELICGRASTQLANVYFRWRGQPDVEITGYVEGPFSTFGQTLTARSTLRDLGPGDGRLLQAQVVDPVFWTPLHPSFYELHCEVRDSQSHANATVRFGIRFFGTRRDSFVLESKRWVFRGLYGDSWNEADLEVCRELAAGIAFPWRRAQTVEDCRSFLTLAADYGIPLAVDLTELDQGLRETLRDLSWHPAVLLAIVDREQAVDQETIQTAANICLAERVRSLSDPPREWANAICLELGNDDKSSTEAPSQTPREMPVMMVRRGTGTVAERRAACDVLQRDLVHQGDFAAYIV